MSSQRHLALVCLIPLACGPEPDVATEPDLAFRYAGPKARLSITVDTHVLATSPDAADGSGHYLRIGGSDRYRSLLQVDTSAIEAAVGDMYVDTAYLALLVADNDGQWAPDATISAHRVTQAWDADATWSCENCPQGTWSMDGPAVPYNTEPSFEAPVSASSWGYFPIVVTDDVQAILDGDNNNGWLLRKSDESAPGELSVYSSDKPYEPYQAELVLWLTDEPPPEPEPEPQGWIVYPAKPTGWDPQQSPQLGPYEIWATRDDGSRTVRLTPSGLTGSGPVPMFRPSVSWDGEHILTNMRLDGSGNQTPTNQGWLWTMNIDGSDLHGVVPTALPAAGWGSDNDSVYYTHWVVCSEDLRRTSGFDDSAPRETLWTSDTVAHIAPNPTDPDIVLITSQPCGSGQTLLILDLSTGTTQTVPGPTDGHSVGFSGKWSEDGERIVYTNSAQTPSGRRSIWISEPDTGIATLVYEPPADESIAQPVFGNDDTRVYWSQFTGPDVADTQWIDLETGERGSVPTAPYVAGSISWREFAYEIDENGDGVADGIGQ